MELLSIIQFPSGLMTSKQSIDNAIGSDLKERNVKEAIMSVICELTMEYGHHTAISDDNTVASFIFDALLCEDLICDVTFMRATRYTVEVTMDLEKAERPMHEEHIGHYIYLPIRFVMTEPDAKEPYIDTTYHANIRACSVIQGYLNAIGRAWVYNPRLDPVRQTPRRRPRFASNACEAMAMDD